MVQSVHVKNADRMMTYAEATEEGVKLVFADGCSGIIPFADLPDIGEVSNLADIDLPNPYEAVLRTTNGETIELPWDFARHYCDASYRPRIESIALAGAKSIGERIRKIREQGGMTQENLAAAAGIGRVTLVRVESGEQSPRLETLAALARVFGRPVSDLLVNDDVSRE